MPSPFPPFASLALHQGNSRNLQLVGVGDDGALCLVAWQSHATGVWTVPDTNVLAFQTGTFSAVALASGNSDRLQVLGLGADQQIYLAAWQYEDGTWIEPIPANAGPMGDPARRYTAVAAGRGAGYLNVFGLGSDGRIYVVATQDDAGHWQADGRILSAPGTSYAAIVPVTDAQGWLQLLGLGTDGRAYWVASLSDGWGVRGKAIGNPKHRYTALAAALSNGGNLQVTGLGTDRKIYLAAWQDKKQAWHVRKQDDGRVGKNDRPYATVAAHIGADRNLQVVCLGTDGKAYLAAYLDKDGAWHAPSSKSNGPLGNSELVYQALMVASGPGSDATHPGELDVIGLGAGFDDGLPYLATRQDKNGTWHAGQPLFSGRSSPMEGNWQTSFPGGVWLNGCLAYDTVWAVTGDRVVRGFDHFTGAETRVFPKFGDNAVPRNVEPFQDGLLVYCADGWFYFVDLAPDAPDPKRIAYCDGEPAWMQARGGSVFAFSEKSGVVRVPSKAEGVPPSRDGQIVIGAYGTGHTVGWPSLGPDMVLATVTEGGSAVCALDPVDLQRVARCALPAKPSWIQTACNGSAVVLCVNDGKTVCAVPTSLEKVAWQAHFSVPVFRQLACDASYCYVPLADGSVKILNIADGTPARGKNEIKLTQPLDTVLLDGGVLYGASAAGGFICAIDTATGQVLIERTAGGATLIGADNGVVYFGDQKTVRAMRLAGLFRRFYAEATLMQDVDIPAPGLGAPVKAPAIQTEITLYDKSGGPYAQQQVRIGATQPVTIRCNGVDHAIGTADVPFATLPTDVAGRVRISLRPTNLTSPSLALFTTFMDGDLSLLLRPDAQLHDKLANINGADLKQAKGYDGKPVVKDEYCGNDTILNNTASMMSASIQMVKGSLDRRQTLLAGTLGGRQMRYLARGCDMETICCCPQGDYTCRTVCHRNFAFDLTPANTSFDNDLDQRQTEAWLAAHPLSTTPPPPRPGSPEGSWDDFWDDVKDGAAAVQNAIIYAADAVADDVRTVVTWTKQVKDQIVDYTYEFVVDTIEKAVTLVEGIFNTIVGTIGKVLEALSFLFNRDRIIAVKNLIRTHVDDAWPVLLGQEGQEAGLLFEAGAKVDRMLGKLNETIDQAFAQVRTSSGGVSGPSAQGQLSGSGNPAKGGSTSRWLESRVGTQVLSPEVLMGTSGSGKNGIAAFPPISIPAFPVPPGLREDIEDLIQRVSEKASAGARQTLVGIQSRLNPGGTGSSMFATTVSVLLDIMQLAVDITITVVRDIWTTVVKVLAKLLRSIKTFITASIYIPVVSELYAYFTGADKGSMSILDLTCLLAAVPASLVLPVAQDAGKGIEDVPLAQIFGIVAGSIQALATTFMGVFSGVFTAIQAKEYIPETVIDTVRIFQSLLFLGVGGAARIMLFVSDWYSNEKNADAFRTNTALWIFPTLTLIGDCLNLFFPKDNKTIRPWFGLVLGVFWSILAIAVMGVYHDSIGNAFVITFNVLVTAAFIIRAGLVFAGKMPLQYQLLITAISTGLLAASGGIKLIGALLPPKDESMVAVRG